MRTLLIILALAGVANASPRTRGAYDAFRAAHAQCKQGGTALDTLVSHYWKPDWAQSFVNYQSATDAQRREFDQLADRVFGTEERADAKRLICDYRVTDHHGRESDGNSPPRYEIVVRDDKCAREHSDQGCWCEHRLEFERVGGSWFYIGDGKLCGVTSWSRYRTRLGLPGDYARYGAVQDIDVAIEKLRALVTP